ncbi:MAG: SU10 major capsid protein [Fusobacteriaceae bacterium]
MTMLRTFDLKGNKLSFADWISNLSPCETPFVSMIPKEKVDQTQYSWQTDRLAQPNKQASAPAGGAPIDPDSADIIMDSKYSNEGSAMVSENRFHTKVHTNFTQIFRKVVRVSDTTKKISLYGRGSELGYQMEKAGMEIKRDLEHAILNSVLKGQLGTASAPGAFDGFQNLVAPLNGKCYDTGAVVNKAVTYKFVAAAPRHMFFSKEQVFDLTYNLYLAGARANKIMFHPMHMSIFSDWVSTTMPYKSAAGAVIPRAPHLHRMFDGLDTKYNAAVKKIRDPLGQEFTLIPNRHMPLDQLFFFNENDWSQMILREPQKTTLAKMGSSEKQMIEFEVGLRHRNPFASGILKFTEENKHTVDIQIVAPQNIVADNVATAKVVAIVRQSDGQPGPTGGQVELDTFDEEGNSVSKHTVAPAADATGAFPQGTITASSSDFKIPVAKGGKRLKVVATYKATPDSISGVDTAVMDTYISRD